MDLKKTTQLAGRLSRRNRRKSSQMRGGRSAAFHGILKITLRWDSKFVFHHRYLMMLTHRSSLVLQHKRSLESLPASPACCNNVAKAAPALDMLA